MNHKRRSQIAKMLEEQQTVTNKELMECFDISIETVRRDISYLEKQGILTKVYGGAVLKKVSSIEPLYTNREQENNDEKQLIAEVAESFIEQNDIVFFDLGTTVEMVAKKIKKSKNVHAFTNAIRTAVALAEQCEEVIITGGRLRPKELSLSGSLTEMSLKRFNINTAIIGVAGVGENGFTDFITDEAGIRSQVIENSNNVIVVADYAKFGVQAMCKVCDLEDVDVLITDSKAPKELLNKIRKKGVKVVVV